MSSKQQKRKILSWALQYKIEQPRQYRLLIRECGKEKGMQIAAESAYILQHGHCPEWGVYITRFETDSNGNYTFIEGVRQ